MRDGRVVKAPFVIDISADDYLKRSHIFVVDLQACDTDVAPEYQNSASMGTYFFRLTENRYIQDLCLVDRCEETSESCLGEEIWCPRYLLFGGHRARNDIWIDVGIRVNVEWERHGKCKC